MFLLKLHLFTLTLHGMIFYIESSQIGACPKGQRLSITRNREHCEDCKEEFFQDQEKRSQVCQPCTICDKASGSFIANQCTKTSNTICKCHEGFVAAEKDFSTCRCDAGFGKGTEDCTKCEDGSFSESINSPCKKWKKCKYGVRINGSRTSDVICNERPQTDASADASPTVGSEEPTQTHELLTTTTATTITSPTRQIAHPNAKVQPSSPSGTAESFGFLITFTTVGLLVLTIMFIKLYFAFYKEKHESVQKHDFLCRRPVEEIGGGSEVSLKVDREENGDIYACEHLDHSVI